MVTKRKTTSKRSGSGERELRGFFAEDATPKTIRVHSPRAALTLSSFYAGVRLYTSTIASLPLVLYKRQPDGGRERDRDNPVYPILHDRPNPAQTRATFVEQVVRNLFLYGDSFALVQRDGEGELTNLFPLAPGSVRVALNEDTWEKYFFVDERAYGSEEVLHFMMNSEDGIQGTPLLKYAAEALGLSKQVQEAATSYYQHAIRTPVFVKATGKLNQETRKALEETFGSKHGGARNSGKTPVIENADIGAFPNTTAADAQLLEALGSNVADMARWLSLSPIQLGDYTQAHYAALSADNTFFYQRSIAPFLSPIELELNTKLFREEPQSYCEFNVDSILRGDALEQAQVFNSYVQMGAIGGNEVRQKLNLNAIDGLDVPYVPNNMAQPKDPNAEDAPPEAEDEPLDVNAFLATVDKIASKEFPPEAAVAILSVACPQVPEATIRTIVTALAAKPAQPEQEQTPNADATQPDNPL